MQPLNQLNLYIFLSKGHLKQLVLVQLSLAVTQKVIFLPFPVPRVASNIVRIVCIAWLCAKC